MVAFRRIGCLLVLASSVFVSLAVGEEPAQKKAEDPAAEVRKVAERAEIHGIGLSRPANCRIDMTDVTDWPKFAEALRSRKGPGGRIADLLTKMEHDLLANDKVVAHIGDVKPPDELVGEVYSLRSFVANRLTRIIDRPDFYTEEAFKGVTLSKELKDALALGGKRTPHQTALMNRRILEAAFPNVFTETPDRFRTVRVEVLAGKEVVLVLSSSEQCRWEVKLREGAKVTGVLLCGYYSQEVAGVGDVPILHRTYYGPDGKLWKDSKKHFYEHDVKADRFKMFAASVKDVTGKDFAKFQGESQPEPGSEPYIVLPVADR